MTLKNIAASVVFVLISSVSIAFGQTAAEQQALSRNCGAISIDQCYRDGLIRLINAQFVPQISAVLTDSQRSAFRSVKFQVVEDRDALGANSSYADGVGLIRITSSVGYHIALFASAGMMSIELGKDWSTYIAYQEKAVAILAANTQRAALGQSLLPTPSYDEVEGIDAATVGSLMQNPTALGMSAYFSEVITFWALAHETGHQVLGHTRILASAPGTPRKPLEVAADDFASRALVRMGYSVYPTIFLMGYFSAIEESGGGSPDDYPPSLCRLANVFTSAWSERAAANAPAPRDAINQQWNAVMDQPALRAEMMSVVSSPQCQG